MIRVTRLLHASLLVADPAHGRPAHGGRDRHLALGVEDWEGLRRRLDRLDSSYRT